MSRAGIGEIAVESIALPDGVILMPLKTHPDNRGELTEIFRNEWHRSPLPAQWTIHRAKANALHGVHVDRRSWKYVCVIAGEVIVGLHDVRPHPDAARSVMFHLARTRLQMLVIPNGVARGFYSPQESTLLLGTSEHSDSSGHFACRWDSPELSLNWPCTAPELSPEDRAAGSYAEAQGAFSPTR